MIKKIVSGGQTGVDQGALDAALLLKIDTGGYCPKGRLSENGPIPKRYALSEASSKEYSVRTALNVFHSDGTLILKRGPLEGGTLFTYQKTQVLNKPCLVLQMKEEEKIPSHVFYEWVSKYNIEILNVAGPRESKNPGIKEQTFRFLLRLLNNNTTRTKS